MKRSHRIIVVSHCLLNANAKVRPLALYPGVLLDALRSYIEQGVGIVQLPCPESSYLGVNRWGMSREQYDHPRFRRHCRRILTPVMDQLEAYRDSGCDIIGVVGADGSPNCGIHRVPLGLAGGVIGAMGPVENQVGGLRSAEGTGVFMEVARQILAERNIGTTFMAVDENHPGKLIIQSKGD